MLGGDERGYLPLAEYGWWWAVLALGIILLIALWYVLVLLLTRKKAGRNGISTSAQGRAAVRARYLARVDDIVARYEHGEMDGRAAHAELGTVLRLFAEEIGGVRAPVMTLDDLTRARLGPIAHAVSVYYPAEFARVSLGDVTGAAHLAREAVKSWG